MTMLASQRWRLMVEEEHAQSDAMRGAVPPPEDHWRPYASNFRDDPRRAGDLMVQRLLELLGPNDTLLDVGAGGGRLALPLALHCRGVVAVEPSASMSSVLQQQAQESDIKNVSLVQSSWEDARGLGPVLPRRICSQGDRRFHPKAGLSRPPAGGDNRLQRSSPEPDISLVAASSRAGTPGLA